LKGADRITPQAVAGSPRYRIALERLAAESGRPIESVAAEADACLQELRSGHTRFFHGLTVRAGRALCGRGYAHIDYDPEQVARLRPVFERHPCVVLSSHRSYLDGGALTVGFHDHGLPRTFEFVGINMAFWPLGAMWRRMGGILLRRRLADPVYKFALREFLGCLVEQGRHLRWFIEGTRSRSGKLGPPKLGLLAYVVEAYLQERSDDLMLVPVSVSYDELHEVEEFAGAARGEPKNAESLGWLIRYIRAQRGRFGNVYVRFGEPVSVRGALGPPAQAAALSREARELALAKLAFEVSWRINQATPITGIALVAIALLGARQVPVTLAQMRFALAGYLRHAQRRGLPLAAGADLKDPRMLARSLDALVSRGVACREQGADGERFVIAADGHLRAAYYRNSLIHFFLIGAIAELALLIASEQPAAAREAAFVQAACELRDLLKFEFFFQDRDMFHDELLAEARRLDPHWPASLALGEVGARARLETAETLSSDMMLRSFLEPYLIVADTLREADAAAHDDDATLLEACARRGEDYQQQGRLANPESVSRVLFASGLRLARHRGLMGQGAGAIESRQAMTAQLRKLLAAMDVVHAVAVRRVQAMVTPRVT
jgi:glycerol-3-phosphate O-acyltransferase